MTCPRYAKDNYWSYVFWGLIINMVGLALTYIGARMVGAPKSKDGVDLIHPTWALTHAGVRPIRRLLTLYILITTVIGKV